MRLVTRAAPATAFILLACLACPYAQPDMPARQESPDSAVNQAMNQTAKFALGTADRDMMTALAQANIAELDMAQLAQTKPSNPQVIQFAKRMIDDHTQAFKDLSGLADGKRLTLPKEADVAHQQLLKKLNALNGKDFDREYMAKAGIADHAYAKELMDKIASSAQDLNLKELGRKLQPIIDMHLKMAKALEI